MPTRKYTIATLDFLSQGGDGYTMIAKGEKVSTGGAMAKVVGDYIKKAGDAKVSPASPFVATRLIPIRRRQ